MLDETDIGIPPKSPMICAGSRISSAWADFNEPKFIMQKSRAAIGVIP